MTLIYVILVIFGIWIVYLTISLFIKTIGKTIRQNLRDKAAKEVLTKININFEREMKEIDIKMQQMEGCDYHSMTEDKEQPLSSHANGICPRCGNGHVIVQRSESGLIWGCNNFHCTYTETYVDEGNVLAQMRDAYK